MAISPEEFMGRKNILERTCAYWLFNTVNISQTRPELEPNLTNCQIHTRCFESVLDENISMEALRNKTNLFLFEHIN